VTTSEELIERMLECTRVLDAQDAERPQFILAGPAQYRMILRLLDIAKPFVRRRGARGRKKSIQRRIHA
jgi:hypothetical protein